MPQDRKRRPYFSQEHQSWVIPLTKGVIALVDEDVAQTLGCKFWCASSDSRFKRCWYAVRRLPAGKLQYMHRAILSSPTGLEVDHKLKHAQRTLLIDNRRSNLRVCARRENGCNLRQRNRKSLFTSRFKGVYFRKDTDRWSSRIKKDYKMINLGCFSDEVAAARAYDKKAVELFGEFALTNSDLGLFG